MDPTSAQKGSDATAIAPGPLGDEQAEQALLRGVDARAAVVEAERIGALTRQATGSDVDVLLRLQQDEVVSAFIQLSDQFVGVMGFT